MSAETGRVVVAGADGFVGRLLVQATGGVPLAYGPPGKGEMAMCEAQAIVRSAAVVISAGGFRVRPGLGSEAYGASHAGAVETLASHLSSEQSLVLISSASVLGRDSRQTLGNRTAPEPEAFPHPVYARAKLEAEEGARGAARDRGFRLLILRPAVLYGGVGDGMIGSLMTLARQGIRLRLLPPAARQHLCSTLLLMAAVRRAITPGVLWPEEALVLADPFVLTNADLDRAVVAAAGRAGRRHVATIPFPPRTVGTVLRAFPSSRRPLLDLETWGSILEILGLDTQFDPQPSFEALGLDATLFSRELTWDRVAGGEELDS